MFEPSKWLSQVLDSGDFSDLIIECGSQKISSPQGHGLRVVHVLTCSMHESFPGVSGPALTMCNQFQPVSVGILNRSH